MYLLDTRFTPMKQVRWLLWYTASSFLTLLWGYFGGSHPHYDWYMLYEWCQKKSHNTQHMCSIVESLQSSLLENEIPQWCRSNMYKSLAAHNSKFADMWKKILFCGIWNGDPTFALVTIAPSFILSTVTIGLGLGLQLSACPHTKQFISKIYNETLYKESSYKFQGVRTQETSYK